MMQYKSTAELPADTPDFGSRADAAAFLASFSEKFVLFDAGIHRDQMVPVADGFADHVDGLMAQKKLWTDLLFYTRSLGADFLA